MPININCPTCDQVVSAPEAMAGKRVVCPNCKATVAIPDKPAAKPAEPVALPLVDVEPVPSLPIAHADVAQHVADEQAALRVLRIVYVMLRDDWRRLFTCAHLWPALFLFFLPFVNVSCNGRTIVSQTGLQACHGGFTVDPKLEQAAAKEKIAARKREEHAPWSILTVVYILCVFLGSGLGLLCILAVLFRLRMACAGLHLFSLALGAAAFFAVSGQMILGFPIERHAQQQLEQVRDAEERPLVNAVARGGPGLFLDVTARYSAWLWLSCLLTLISLPAFLVEFLIVLIKVLRGTLWKRADSG
ncbi:MAG TPA: hypothetical protein VFE62_30420 [Gemmataceae bacterium]|nr:hypothetical protein [Gemmataceae bacterium]